MEVVLKLDDLINKAETYTEPTPGDHQIAIMDIQAAVTRYDDHELGALRTDMYFSFLKERIDSIVPLKRPGEYRHFLYMVGLLEGRIPLNPKTGKLYPATSMSKKYNRDIAVPSFAFLDLVNKFYYYVYDLQRRRKLRAIA